MRQQPLAEGYEGRAPFVGARVAPELLEHIERIAEMHGKPKAAVIRAAIAAGLPALEAENAA